MRKAKRTLLAAACACALVVGAVAGTVAYLTATTDEVKNTFTVGDVSFDAGAAIDEAAVNLYGEKLDGEGGVYTGAEGQTLADRVTKNTYKLIPGHNYVKDPTVHMSATTEDAWLFVKVTNEISAIEADATIAAQMVAKGWTAIDAANGIYAWPTKVTKDQDVLVFETFKIKTDADVADYADKTIKIEAYAVQADGFSSASAAWTAAPLVAWTTPVTPAPEPVE